MIPRIIHYCWYGGKPIPAEYAEYIEGWRQRNPGYELRRWDETNSPMHLPYLRTAHRLGKWANLSNYVRLHALWREGGIYLDTDVELLGSLDPFLEDDCFLGFESGALPGEPLQVNNAVFGAAPRHPFVQRCGTRLLETFDGGERPPDSSPVLVTAVLGEMGLAEYGAQVLGGVRLYPAEIFYPLSYADRGPGRIGQSTVAVHHWAATWKGPPKARSPVAGVVHRFRHLYDRVVRRLAALDVPPLPALRRRFSAAMNRRRLLDILASPSVLHGPFRGMALPPGHGSAGSKAAPKIVGSYESCLHAVLYSLVDRTYEQAVVLGCGDGYYAVGLAMLFPGIRVFAVDSDPAALESAARLAALNGVAERVTFRRGDAVPGDLEVLSGRRALVICDIEGAEGELLDGVESPALARTDLVVELHDFRRPGTRERILRRFADTHEWRIVPQEFPNLARFPSLGPLAVQDALRLTAEKRPARMEWAVLESGGTAAEGSGSGSVG